MIYMDGTFDLNKVDYMALEKMSPFILIRSSLERVDRFVEA